MKWLAFSTNGFAFTGVLLALSYKARFGRSMKWLALSTNCLAFARLRHRGGDKARGDQSNKSTRLIATSGLFLKLSLGLCQALAKTVFDLDQIQDRRARAIVDAGLSFLKRSTLICPIGSPTADVCFWGQSGNRVNQTIAV